MFSLIHVLSFNKFITWPNKMSAFKWWTLYDYTSFTDMNLVELKYHPFMISLNKCTGSCNL